MGNQGKRKDQIKYSENAAFYSLICLVITMVVILLTQ